jgi:hypothetical protein
MRNFDDVARWADAQWGSEWTWVHCEERDEVYPAPGSGYWSVSDARARAEVAAGTLLLRGVDDLDALRWRREQRQGGERS